MRRLATRLLLTIAVIGLVLRAAWAGAADDSPGRTFTLETAADQFVVDGDSGRLRSLRAKAAPEVELLATAADHPAFAIDYLGDDHQFRGLDSRNAKHLAATCKDSGDVKTLSLV